MTVEIRELHIRAVVGPGAVGEESRRPSGGAEDEEAREALVALCVERVMDVLARERER